MGQFKQFTPSEQSKESPIRRELYQKLSNKSMSQPEAAWAKIEFSGKASAPKSDAREAALAAASFFC